MRICKQHAKAGPWLNRCQHSLPEVIDADHLSLWTGGRAGLRVSKPKAKSGPLCALSLCRRPQAFTQHPSLIPKSETTCPPNSGTHHPTFLMFLEALTIMRSSIVKLMALQLQEWLSIAKSGHRPRWPCQRAGGRVQCSSRCKQLTCFCSNSGLALSALSS